MKNNKEGIQPIQPAAPTESAEPAALAEPVSGELLKDELNFGLQMNPNSSTIAFTDAPRKSHTLFILLIILLVGFFATAGVFAYLYFTKPVVNYLDNITISTSETPKASNASSDTSKHSDPLTVEPVVTDKKDDVFAVKDAEVKALVAKFKEIAESVCTKGKISDIDTHVAAKVDALKTHTTTEKGYGFEVKSDNFREAQVEEKFNKVKGLLEKYKDKLLAEGFVIDAESSMRYVEYVNKETDIVCYITSGLPNSFGCGYSKWIKDETVAFVNELAEAYKAKEGSYPDFLGVSNAKLEDSSVSPYQTLQVRFENAAALFYRVSPDAEWKFFAGTQGPLDCSDYDTQELKNAYAGQTCYVGQESMTVQP